MALDQKIKTLCTYSVLLGGFVLTGCGGTGPFEPGTVVEEAGTVVERNGALVPSPSTLTSNETVKLGGTYVIKWQSDEGTLYMLGVVADDSQDLALIEALSLAIEPGSRVGIQGVGYLRPVDTIQPYNIEVLGDN